MPEKQTATRMSNDLIVNSPLVHEQLTWRPEAAEHFALRDALGSNLMASSGADCERKMRDWNETKEMLHTEHSGRSGPAKRGPLGPQRS